MSGWAFGDRSIDVHADAFALAVCRFALMATETETSKGQAMKVFFDLEFTGLHQNTTPISLAMRAHDGHEFYAEFTDYDHDHLDDWLIGNVLQNLILPDSMSEWAGEVGTSFITGTRAEIATAAGAWLKQLGDSAQLVGDCLAYDWVLFCELFGGAQHIPKNVNYIPVEFCTVLEMCKIDPDVQRDELLGVMGYPGVDAHQPIGLQHNALHDVRVMASIWDGLEYEAYHCANIPPGSFFRTPKG